MIDTLRTELGALDELSATFPEIGPKAAIADPDRTRKRLAQLERLQASDNTTATDLSAANAPLLLAAFRTGSSRPGRQTAEIDYPAAPTPLCELLRQGQNLDASCAIEINGLEST